MAEVERARPLLGTRVAMRVEGLAPKRAHAAIDRAFTEVEGVQRAMSFHDPDSELSRLNREAVHRALPASTDTHRVLALALRVASASGGKFDPCIASRLVARGVLPVPRDAPTPDMQADWRDVRLLADQRVRFRRPLWLDLGGIAKGYAVDRAAACLRAAGAHSGCVDAGGDLRVFGPREHTVVIRPCQPCGSVPLLRLRGAAVASSAGTAARDAACNGVQGSEPLQRSGIPLDGRSGLPLPAECFVSVVARRACLADALTKVVLADPEGCDDLLRAFGAEAFSYSFDSGWRRHAA